MDRNAVLYRIWKVADTALTVLIAAALCLCGAYAVYGLWDDHQIEAAAEAVQAELRMLKPAAGAPFTALQTINPDVRAWVTLDGTRIDHPVVQGKTNLTYLDTDLYGAFSLSGSIYLDARNAADFSQPYALLYGHHMENGGMFGDLERYEDSAFFVRHRTGTLRTPVQDYALTVFACLLVGASEEAIFQPEQWQQDIGGLLDYTAQHAQVLDGDVLAALRTVAAPQILALSTCSSAFTDARTVVLAVMRPQPTGG
ncbi:MAG: class B sortase [Eubacteriales bacterium]|nr:class B sortase [Eubacteriales bacterium]